jgi:transcriptional regulator with XRE-family HTH domain
VVNLGDLLRQLRGKESLRSVSKRAGISHNYLSIVEKGVDPRTGAPVKPSPDTLRSLSRAYNYPYKDLMLTAGYSELEEQHQQEIESVTKSINAISDLKDLILRYDDEQIIDMYHHTSNGEEIKEEDVKKIISYVRFVLKDS